MLPGKKYTPEDILRLLFVNKWLVILPCVAGLGLAETLPGPLIKVTQFVGFLAAWRDAAPFSPVAAGVLGAFVTTWVTFAVPILLIFAGAPFIEQLRANRHKKRTWQK